MRLLVPGLQTNRLWFTGRDQSRMGCDDQVRGSRGQRLLPRLPRTDWRGTAQSHASPPGSLVPCGARNSMQCLDLRSSCASASAAPALGRLSRGRVRPPISLAHPSQDQVPRLVRAAPPRLVPTVSVLSFAQDTATPVSRLGQGAKPNGVSKKSATHRHAMPPEHTMRRSTSTVPTHRSAIAFARGACTGVRRMRMLSLANTHQRRW
jgi:hypothetical protein